MKIEIKPIFKVIALFTVLLLTACSSVQRHTLTQAATIDALLAGVYDGEITCRDLLKYGDTGIGTFENLDGEMVVTDGTVYQIMADGNAVIPLPDVKSPFASVVKFESEDSFIITEELKLPQLQSEIDKHCRNTNGIYAFIIDGDFSFLKTRSVPAQKRPFPPLAEAVKNQIVSTVGNISGRVIGFRIPDFMKGINVPGYHLHFISADRKRGGHILDLVIKQGEVRINTADKFYMILPAGNQSFNDADLKKDRSKELDKVEK